MTDFFDTASEAEIRSYAREQHASLTEVQAEGTRLTDECRSVRAVLANKTPLRQWLEHGPSERFEVLLRIIEAAWKADNKHGTPASHLDRPDGTASADQVAFEVLAKDRCDRAGRAASWAMILDEECAEALAATMDNGLELELEQVAATALRWLEAIRLRRERDGK